MSLLSFCEWLQDTPGSTALRESILLWPVLETVHAVGIVLVLGTIWTVDLRLLGLRMRREPVWDVTQQLLPWTWVGFVFMFSTGSLLVWSEPLRLYNSPFFRAKLILLMLAGLNALTFHVTIYRKVTTWGQAPVPPLRARIAGFVSLITWMSVVAAGRSIGYGP